LFFRKSELYAPIARLALSTRFSGELRGVLQETVRIRHAEERLLDVAPQMGQR
jgi:hypothetical protein